MNQVKKKCYVKTCNKSGDFTCEECRVVTYCSKECQKADWNSKDSSHKLLCFKPKEDYVIPEHITTFKGHGEKDLIVVYSRFEDIIKTEENGGGGNDNHSQERLIPQWYLFLKSDGQMNIKIPANKMTVCTFQQMEHLARLKCMDPVERILLYYTPLLMTVLNERPFK